MIKDVEELRELFAHSSLRTTPPGATCGVAVAPFSAEPPRARVAPLPVTVHP